MRWLVSLTPNLRGPNPLEGVNEEVIAETAARLLLDPYEWVSLFVSDARVWRTLARAYKNDVRWMKTSDTSHCFVF